VSYHRPLGAVPFSRASAQVPRLVRPAQVAPIRSTTAAGQMAPRTALAPIAQRSADTMGPRPTQVAQFSRTSASAQAQAMGPTATVRHTGYAGNYRPVRALPPVPSSAWFQTPRSAVTAVSVPFQPMPARRSVTAVTDLPFQPPAPPTGRRRGRGRRRRR
jgi:hypothetical protein